VMNFIGNSGYGTVTEKAVDDWHPMDRDSVRVKPRPYQPPT
jgi:hypothetical protein